MRLLSSIQNIFGPRDAVESSTSGSAALAAQRERPPGRPTPTPAHQATVRTTTQEGFIPGSPPPGSGTHYDVLKPEGQVAPPSPAPPEDAPERSIRRISGFQDLGPEVDAIFARRHTRAEKTPVLPEPRSVLRRIVAESPAPVLLPEDRALLLSVQERWDKASAFISDLSRSQPWRTQNAEMQADVVSGAHSKITNRDVWTKKRAAGGS